MDNRYTSAELYHFAGFRHPENDEANFKILRTILKAGAVSFGPHFPLQPQFRCSYSWDLKDILNGALIVPEVTCFADIPRECLRIHTAKYGRFGISFPRSFLVKKGARPVIYVPLQSSDPQSGWGNIYTDLMVADWIAKWKGFEEFAVGPVRPNIWKTSLGHKPQNRDDAIIAMNGMLTQGFLAFIKVFDSDLPDNDPRNFYIEREWRIPNPLPFEKENIASVVMPESYLKKFCSEFPDLAERVCILPDAETVEL